MGGYSYFYPEQIEGPPDYVSDVEVADDATAVPSPAAPAPTEESNYAVYYRPGDLTGTRYQTLKACLQAREQAGNLGACYIVHPEDHVCELMCSPRSCKSVPVTCRV